jgi:two-component system cell cycle response regulator CpdR
VPAAAHHPRTVLVVDDDPSLCELLTLMLEMVGYKVTCAGNGRLAGKCLQQAVFVLVITDMLMPDRDGLEFIADVRQQQPYTRIIAMTGGGHIPGDKYLKMASGLGAHGVLKKPFSRPELLSAVEQVLAASTVTPPTDIVAPD